jgi:hypothetical protein
LQKERHYKTTGNDLKLIENDCETTLTLKNTLFVDLGEDKFGEVARYRVRIFSDDKEKKWFAIRAKHEGKPFFCFESPMQSDVVAQAERALQQYEKFKRKRKT